MQDSETSKISKDIIKLLSLDEIQNDVKVRVLIQEAQTKFSNHVLTRFIEQIGDADKIKQASPMELLNCILKLLRIIKEFESTPQLQLLTDKLTGVKENIDLKEILPDAPGEDNKKPGDSMEVESPGIINEDDF